MNARDLTALVHLAGFATGIILYVMLAVMTRRRLGYVEAVGDPESSDRLPLFTALLGILWNAGAMFVYAMRDFGAGADRETWSLVWIGAIAYTALGFLPAVVVHSTRNRSLSREHRWVVGVAYAGSAVAGALHIAAAAHGDMFSSIGLLLLTLTYAVVIAVLAIIERGRPGSQRTITAVALAAFAVSALHLSRHTWLVDADSWPMELIGHHASLPLVLVILYQDYRFAFADLFLKRALSIVGLVALVALLYGAVVAPLIDPHAIAARVPVRDSHLFSTAVLLGAWISTALAYPWIQRRMFRFVDRVVLRRADYRRLVGDVAQRLSMLRTPDAVLDAATTVLAAALDASKATWDELDAARPVSHPLITVDAHRCCATVAVPSAGERVYRIDVNRLRGGRTLLSDDLAMIESVSALVGRRLDELRLEQERMERAQREDAMCRLATEAELRALRAQLNPHFLFNALNTLGHLMQAAPDRALATLYRLTGLLRAVLRRTNGQFVSLREELEIVEAYLAIERERFQERLTVRIDVPSELLDARVPALLLQPLVENAVKHGIAPLKRGGSVSVVVRRDAGPADDISASFLRVVVEDTGAGMMGGAGWVGLTALNGPARTARAESDGTGLGLANLEARLRHYYGPSAGLTVRETAGGGTTIEIRFPEQATDRSLAATTH